MLGALEQFLSLGADALVGGEQNAEAEEGTAKERYSFIDHDVDLKRVKDLALEKQAHREPVTSICRINNQILATCSHDEIKLWNWKNGALLKQFTPEKSCSALLSSGQYLFSAQENLIIVYNWRYLKMEDLFYQEDVITA